MVESISSKEVSAISRRRNASYGQGEESQGVSHKPSNFGSSRHRGVHDREVGDAQAAKYLDALDRLFGLIEAEPGILLPVPVIDQLITHSVDSHVVVCTKWHDDVLVLTIVQASRDLIPLLDRLLPTLKFEVETMKKRLP